MYGLSKSEFLPKNGVLFSGQRTEGRAFHQLCDKHRTPVAIYSEHHRLIVRSGLRAPRTLPGWCQAYHGVARGRGCEVHGRLQRFLWSGTYGMSGRAFVPRFMFTWHNRKIR